VTRLKKEGLRPLMVFLLEGLKAKVDKRLAARNSSGGIEDSIISTYKATRYWH
jgi:hypothetical protein